MKYFTLELLNESNDISDEEFEINNRLWMDNLTTYWNEFKNYESRLPVRFVKEYCKHAFHDYSIESINFSDNGTRKNDSRSVEIKINFEQMKFMLKYIGVTKFNVKAEDINCFRDNVFLYSEILPVDEKKMSHEIIFEDRNIVYIEFKKLIFKKIYKID